MIRQAILLMLLLWLCACGQNEPRKNPATKSKMGEDVALLQDVTRAGPELERRLMASIRVQDGLLLVNDPVIGHLVSYVMPANSPWVLSCGIGLSVVFGNSVSGERSSVGNDVEVRLTQEIVAQKDCAVLGPRLGRHLMAIQGTKPNP
jgi:hypothetical protein